jgi:hypothetical protein
MAAAVSSLPTSVSAGKQNFNTKPLRSWPMAPRCYYHLQQNKETLAQIVVTAPVLIALPLTLLVLTPSLLREPLGRVRLGVEDVLLEGDGMVGILQQV